ncbi:hypothetical protein DdX_11014 [Ditylenchus destructor]|uniref:Uncharacterized protein n=1 Tax=Ditylenchus destructor TaxID=166010 RepID=A0AAD4MZ18_9BILA|nr:hypothetical protein DdX_11014 [Ditylenchus destructor]
MKKRASTTSESAESVETPTKRRSIQPTRKLSKIKVGEPVSAVELQCVYIDLSKPKKSNQWISKIVGADLDGNFATVFAWAENSERLLDNGQMKKGKFYRFENLVAEKQEEEYNMGNVPYQLGFKASACMKHINEDPFASMQKRFYEAVINKFVINATLFKPRKWDDASGNDLIDLEGIIQTVGHVYNYKKEGYAQCSLDVACVFGKHSVNVTFWNGFAGLFHSILQGSEGFAVQLQNVVVDDKLRKVTYTMRSRFKLIKSEEIKVSKSLRQFAEFGCGNVKSDFRLKALTLPASSAAGICNVIATDGQFKALIQFGFDSDMDIGDEFVVKLSVVKVKGDLLCIVVNEPDNVEVFEDQKMSEEFDIDELEYPPV